MKKIAFVIPWYAEKIPGGAEAALRGLVEHLEGANVEILSTCVEQFNSDWNLDYYKPGCEVVNGITVRRFKVRKRDKAAFDKINDKLMHDISITENEEEIFMEEMVNSCQLYEYIENSIDNYDLFVFTPYMFGTTYYGIEKCREKAICIPCLHDEAYARMGKFKELFPHIRGMIFLAKDESILAHQLYDLSQVKTAVLGTGIETSIDCDGERFRNKYNIKTPYIVYAGRKDYGKNVYTLVEYFSTYKMENESDLKLVLIGGGDVKIPEDMKSDILDLGFIPIQDKYDAFAGALFLCNPSKYESFSLVIMESWLCEKPVVVYGGCEVTKDFVIQSNGGLWFESYLEFVGCINYISGHNEEAMQMGKNGKTFVLEHFAWNVVIKRYMDFFNQCCIRKD